MPRMRTWLCCVMGLVASGCIVPRSMVMGQMAAPVGRGAMDVGVHTGVLYAAQRNPQFTGQPTAGGEPQKTEERTSAFSIPAFEANLNYGFNEHVALNVHGSSAGFQPGLKLTVNRSKVAHFALMPQLAFGYASLGQSTFVGGQEGVLTETAPRSGTSFTFLGGLKAMFSHRSGFYAGVGYDFTFNRQFNAAIIGPQGVTQRSETVYSTTAHQVSINVGLDIALGLVHLRPEVAFAVYPGIAQTISGRLGATENPSMGATGGFGWAIFPGFTIAIQTPRREMTADEEEEEAAKEEEERKQKRRRGGEDDEDEDEDEDVRRPAGKKKPRLDEDEDEDRPRKRRPVDLEEE
jgi:hypothetical protein